MKSMIFLVLVSSSIGAWAQIPSPYQAGYDHGFQDGASTCASSSEYWTCTLTYNKYSGRENVEHKVQGFGRSKAEAVEDVRGAGCAKYTGSMYESLSKCQASADIKCSSI